MISDSLLLITWPVKLFPLLIQADWLDMALLPRPDWGCDTHACNCLSEKRVFLCLLFVFVLFFFLKKPSFSVSIKSEGCEVIPAPAAVKRARLPFPWGCVGWGEGGYL